MLCAVFLPSWPANNFWNNFLRAYEEPNACFPSLFYCQPFLLRLRLLLSFRRIIICFPYPMVFCVVRLPIATFVPLCHSGIDPSCCPAVVPPLLCTHKAVAAHGRGSGPFVFFRLCPLALRDRGSVTRAWLTQLEAVSLL